MSSFFSSLLLPFKTQKENLHESVLLGKCDSKCDLLRGAHQPTFLGKAGREHGLSTLASTKEDPVLSHKDSAT